MSTTPARGADEAAAVAQALAAADVAERGLALPRSSRIKAARPTLMIYREGLAQGVAGANRLVYEVEVGNRINVRDFYYIDANTLKVVDKIAGIHEALNRRAIDSARTQLPGHSVLGRGPGFPHRAARG